MSTGNRATATSDRQNRFASLVEGLVKEVAACAEPHEWATKRYAKRMRNGNGEVFEIPALFLQKGPVRILLDPVAYDVPGAEAVVDLYLMPAYDDLASLYFQNDNWTIHYAFPPSPMQTHSVIETKALPFSEATLNQVLDSIAEHAAASI